jgi:hypothetical protein
MFRMLWWCTTSNDFCIAAYASITAPRLMWCSSSQHDVSVFYLNWYFTTSDSDTDKSWPWVRDRSNRPAVITFLLHNWSFASEPAVGWTKIYNFSLYYS